MYLYSVLFVKDIMQLLTEIISIVYLCCAYSYYKYSSVQCTVQVDYRYDFFSSVLIHSVHPTVDSKIS